VRALILADSCNPEWPSLPIVGYKYARALGEHAEVVLVTQVRNRENIERAGLGRVERVYLDTEAIAAPLARLATFLRGGNSTAWSLQMAMDYPSYVAFEFAALKRFRRELDSGRFDVVHRITPMSPTLASPMAKKCPVPFVLGPLNGNLRWPKAFTAELLREREVLSYVRKAYKLLPYHRSMYARSAAILAAFEHTLADVPESALDRAINFPEVGIDPELFSMPLRTRSERMTVLYAGRLVPYKLPEVVVGAFARSPKLRRHRLVVVGDGPERPRLEAVIAEHGLSDCVELLGQRPQPEVAALMRQAEVFAFPSIRELGAGVVVEAMGCGMACVVVDYGAPGTLVGPDRGVRIALADKETLTQRFSEELESLVENPERVASLGAAAYAHATRFYAWDHKAKKTLEVYDWVLGRRAEKPDFWTDTRPARTAVQPGAA
jgi:glycosyltransferase involved in cell wall biosynthesis